MADLDANFLARIEKLNYALGGVLIIVCALLTRQDQALGAAVGVVLTCLNFALLRRLVFKWTSAVKAGDSAGSNRILLILPKMVALMGAVVLSLWLLPIDAIFFVVGYSIFIPAMIVGTVLDSPRPGAADGTGTDHG